MLSGNTADATTLPQFLAHIEQLYGSARRIWAMDRGIPTEAHLELMRARGAQFLVGTPKGRVNRLEAALAARAWYAARPEVRVKLLTEDGDLYVYVESQARIGKERSMRRKAQQRARQSHLPEAPAKGKAVARSFDRRQVEGCCPRAGGEVLPSIIAMVDEVFESPPARSI